MNSITGTETDIVSLILAYFRFACDSTAGCVLGASSLSNRNQGSTLEMGRCVGKEVIDYLDAGACVDQYSQVKWI